jgi:hypothetical protein
VKIENANNQGISELLRCQFCFCKSCEPKSVKPFLGFAQNVDDFFQVFLLDGQFDVRKVGVRLPSDDQIQNVRVLHVNLQLGID